MMEGKSLDMRYTIEYAYKMIKGELQKEGVVIDDSLDDKIVSALKK